jgi:hypothetical protein
VRGIFVSLYRSGHFFMEEDQFSMFWMSLLTFPYWPWHGALLGSHWKYDPWRKFEPSTPHIQCHLLIICSQSFLEDYNCSFKIVVQAKVQDQNRKPKLYILSQGHWLRYAYSYHKYFITHNTYWLHYWSMCMCTTPFIIEEGLCW